MGQDGEMKKTGGKIIMRRANEDGGGEEVHEPSFDVCYGDDGGKFSKFSKNPLVPIGAVGTACILVAGLFSFKSGNTRLSQQLMRARVLAQGATLGVLSLSVARMQMVDNNHKKDQVD